MFYNDKNTFSTTLFNGFVIIELFDLNSSYDSLFQILSIKDFLVIFLMFLYISFMALKMLKFSLSSSNKMFFYSFCLCFFHSQYLYYYDLKHQLLLLIYTNENKDQWCSLIPCIVNFLLQIIFY